MARVLDMANGNDFELIEQLLRLFCEMLNQGLPINVYHKVLTSMAARVRTPLPKSFSKLAEWPSSRRERVCTAFDTKYDRANLRMLRLQEER